MRDQHLRVLLEIGRDFDGGDVLGDRVKTLQIVGGQEEVDLADRKENAVVHAGAALADGDVEPVFAVGAVGQRLVEAAVLGLRHPVGAEGDLVERLGRGRADRSADSDGNGPSMRRERSWSTASVAPCDAHATIGEHERILRVSRNMLPKRDWMEMTWQDIAGGDTARWIAVLPLAAVEQHGPHLPLGVDTYIAEAYLARVRDLLPDDLPVTFLPVQRIGVSAEHLAFPGTLTLVGHNRDRGLDRARREFGARRPAQARPRHQPRRQCRGDGNGGARSAHAA